MIYLKQSANIGKIRFAVKNVLTDVAWRAIIQSHQGKNKPRDFLPAERQYIASNPQVGQEAVREAKFQIMAKEEIPLYCFDTEEPTIRLHASR